MTATGGIVCSNALVSFRRLTPEDVTGEYVSWLNDPDVNRYLECRFTPQTLEGTRRYVARVAANPDTHFFAIIFNETGEHVGNIKLETNPVHKYGDVGVFIGRKSLWGRGLASSAVGLLVDWAFSHLDLNRIESGFYADNTASGRVFEKCGFTLEGVRRDRRISEGKVVDEPLMSITRRDRQGR